MTSLSPSPTWLARLYWWACQRLYAELAWSYDLVSWLVSVGRWADWRRSALHYLPPTPSGEALRVLEIGFGTGQLLREMAHAQSTPRVHPTGLELSPAMHRVATRTLRRAGVHVPRVRAAAQAMPFAENTFDAIISTFPASYIFEPATLCECARVLRSSGNAEARLIIVGAWVTPRAAWLRRLRLPFYSAPSADVRRAIRARLVEAGFAVDETEHGVDWARVSVMVARVRS